MQVFRDAARTIAVRRLIPSIFILECESNLPTPSEYIYIYMYTKTCGFFSSYVYTWIWTVLWIILFILAEHIRIPDFANFEQKFPLFSRFYPVRKNTRSFPAFTRFPDD